MDFLFVLQQARESVPDFVNTIFYFLSEVLVKLYIAIPFVIYWCINKYAGRWMIFSFSSGYFVNQTVKNIACVYRPWILDSRLYVSHVAEKGATGYSFPSGHTATTALVFESLAVWQRKRKWVVAISAVAIFLMAFVRNWLGAHTPTDVICAILIAAVVVVLTMLISKFAESNSRFDWIFLVVGILICAGITIFLQFKNYPMDTDANGNLLADPYKMLTDCYSAAGILCGFLAGNFLEKRFVNFSEDGTVKNKIFRGIFGVFVVIAIYLIFSLALKHCDEHLSHIIKYFAIFFFATYGYPCIFNAVQKRKSVQSTQVQ